MTQIPSSFALDLSNDGIFLWHRKPEQKWEFLGSVPLTSGNLRQQLEALKQAAEAIDPGPRSAIVRIPTAEVKTLTITEDLNATTSIEERIVHTLEAVSNASIKDILFDIERDTDDQGFKIAWTSVDVVKQAQTFVHLIGFTPSQYTTDVDASAFPRHPNFQLHPEPVSKPSPPSPIIKDDPLEDEVVSAMEDFDDHYDDDPIVENLFDVRDDDAKVTEPENTPPTPKAEFGFLWFIALFLIIGTIIAGIYLWPKIHQSTQQKSALSYDQPIIASASTLQIFSLENSQMTL